MDTDYEMPWRPTYELYQAVTWLASSAIALSTGWALSLPEMPFYGVALISAGMATFRGFQAHAHLKRKRRLTGHKPWLMPINDLCKKMELREKTLWLGNGFVWDQPHAQLVYEILKRDKSKILPETDVLGATWIHGVSMDEEDLLLPLKSIEGHTLIVGTTGSGKTRLLDLFVTQAILRGEGVIIVDPKGDKDLEEKTRRACILAGDENLFHRFHPSFPDESCRIDPMRNFSRPTELASRIAAIMPGDGPSDTFRSYSQMAVNNVIQGLLIIGLKPTLMAIRSYVEGPIEELVLAAVREWGRTHHPNWGMIERKYIGGAKTPEQRAQGACDAYRQELKTTKPNQDLEGLLSMFEHDRTHFGKMVASLLPLLGQLTSGHMGDLLSPRGDASDDLRPIVDTKSIVAKGGVLYVSLDSLSDAIVGSAIGSLILADLAAVAGDRYNFQAGDLPVNLYVDEAAEVVNDPLIQLLNKGRGARFQLTLATQTYADFAARLGSQDKARQVLGNVNNTIALRVTDNETQLYVTDGLPTVSVQYVMRTQGNSMAASPQNLEFSGNSGERLMEEESELFKPAMLGQLPNFEFIAKVAGGRVWKGRVPILVG